MKRAPSSSQRGKQAAPKKHMSLRSSAVTFDKVMALPALFQQIMGTLHWKDVIVFGSVNSKYHKACAAQYDTILQPVLKTLESLCGSNVHFYWVKCTHRNRFAFVPALGPLLSTITAPKITRLVFSTPVT